MFPSGGSLVRSPVPTLQLSPCLSAVMAAFSHTTPDTECCLGGSLQAGLYARTPRLVRLPRLFR